MSAGSYCKKVGWGQQKPPLGYQLDRSSPFARDLVGCWLFNEGAGGKYQDISINNLQSSIVGTTISRIITDKSDALHLNTVENGTDKLSFTKNPIYSGGPFTFVFNMRWNSQSNSCQLMSFRRQSAGAAAAISIYNASGSAQLRMSLLVECTTANMGVQQITQPDVIGKWSQFAVVFSNSLTATQSHIYRNGMEPGYYLTTDGTGTFRPLDNEWAIGALYPVGGTQGFACDMRDICLFSRALSADEVSYLYANPYAMVEGYNMGRFFSIASGTVFDMSQLIGGRTLGNQTTLIGPGGLLG
jgi:hypothetical protein